LRLLTRSSPEREEAERFIADRYRLEYGAGLTHFLPILVAVPSGDGRLLAAAGIARADAGALFLERYLPAPVDQVIGRRLGVPVARKAVLEVGNLASASPGGGRLMITSLVRLLQGRGLEWITFTATRTLRNSLSRLGIAAHELAIAERSAVGAEASSWGRYYDHDPRVVACSLQAAWELLYGAGGVA
jgi:HAMP domain-containing protein